MSEALKPCPRCKNAAKHWLSIRNRWRVCCQNEECSCELMPAVGFDTESEAITAWNHRARSGDKIMNWQSIETAPKDGTRLLLFQKTSGDFENVQAVGWWVPIMDFGYWRVPCAEGLWPTHWMPLPAPPEGV